MSNRYQGGFITASYNGLKVPDAPTIGTATAGNTSASVTFTAPSNIGGGAITGYTVISSPGGFTGTGTSSPVSVTGLTNGTAYTFTVVATNAYGAGPASAASNSVTPVPYSGPTSVEYLVVAGGGAGGFDNGGGGGAGGYLTSTIAVTGGSTDTVTVGAGGPNVSAGYGSNGSDSVYKSVTATGGGGGAVGDNLPGASGGSGGGGSGGGAGGAGGAGTSGQGNAGGAASNTATSGGGGGGAGAAGVSGATTSNGGVGLQTSISGTATYYAGGGGGTRRTTSPGVGGNGGGGTGAQGVSGGNPATSGTANTGGGGGGGPGVGGVTPNTAGNGGSGIVIIRYADTYALASSTTGSPTITTAGGYRVYKFTSSGSITW